MLFSLPTFRCFFDYERSNFKMLKSQTEDDNDMTDMKSHATQHCRGVDIPAHFD